VTRPRPLRILIVSAYAPPHIGGVEVIVAQQASSLAALGHRVTVLTSRCGGEADRERIHGYTVLRVPAWNGLESRYGVPVPAWAPRSAWWLGRLIRGADVVHVHDAYHPSVMLAGALARWLGRPLFLTQHVAIVEHGRGVVRLAQRAVYATAGRVLWRWAAAVTVYNPIVAAFLTGRGVPPGRVRLTGNGVDTGYFQPGNPGAAAATRRRYRLRPDVPVILFAGRLVPKKGLDVLLAARGPEYQLVIAGPGRVPAPAPPGVTFVGPLPRAELRDLYQASDVFACPVSGEMLTLTMQEAMACGVPVVASAHPAYSRYGLDPAGVALVAPTAPALRAEFLGILASPGRAERMRTYSRQFAVQRFSWQVNAAGLASDYLAAVRRRAAGRRSGWRRWRWPAVIGLAALAAASSLLFPAARHQWAVSLARQPARYTALFFDHAGALPSRLPAHQPVRLSFTIENHEGRAEQYTYRLTTGSGRGQLTLGESTRAVPAGASWTVSARIRPECGGPSCRVRVSLPGHPETIDVLLTPAAPG
jgi:D-inositol-3-phosphate glycosyltransferase